MVARATLELGSPSPVRAIPRDALVDQFGLHFVYVVVAEGAGHESVRKRVQVRDVPFRPAIVEVVAGVEDGDRIAVSGIQELRDGSRVQPRPSRRHLAGAAPEDPGT
jgi:multidrug efflux pump subunit AcrA (membrane-fusion protein)